MYVRVCICMYICVCTYMYVLVCMYRYICIFLRRGFSSLSFLFFSVYLILAYVLFPWKWMFRHLSLPVPGPELGSM